jgi:L-amino acid N-acyltransferase YncA
MLILRDAVKEDVACILHIYNRAILTTTATFDLEEETLEQRLEWFSHYGGNHPLIVAEMDGLVVGYCYLSVFRTKPAYNRTAEISVYINEHYRGKGIGKLLYAEILKRARTLGYRAIIACITAGNEISVRMHKQFGFEWVGQMKQVGFKFNEWLDIEFYELLLTEDAPPDA